MGWAWVEFNKIETMALLLFINFSGAHFQLIFSLWRLVKCKYVYFRCFFFLLENVFGHFAICKEMPMNCIDV